MHTPSSLHRLDLNLFLVFDAIAREQGVTAAARRLNLSQPAVSHALARLRELLGDPLFERQGHAMVATPLARDLLPAVRQALQTLDQALAGTERFEPASSQRSFTIGVRAALESLLLPSVALPALQQAPGIQLATVRADRHLLEADLLEARLDLALDIALPMGPEIGRQLIRHDRLVVLARSGHPLSQQPGHSPMTLHDYLQADHVQVSSRRSGLGLEDLALAELGLTRQLRVRCQQAAAACALVESSDLLVTLPQRQAEQAAFGRALVVLPMPIPTLPLALWMYWPRRLEHDAGHQWLRHAIVAGLTEPPEVGPDHAADRHAD